MKETRAVPLSCEKCGKPIAVGQLSGDLLSHLFQDNYCRCDKTVTIGPDNASSEKKDGKNFCPRCGLNISNPSQPGSLTGYLFQDIRCKCQSEEDFAPGAMTDKFWKLKNAGLGTTFSAEEFDGTNTLHYAGQRRSQLPPINLAPGAIIGGAYRILGLIGQGGMGEVYLAEHITLGKECALKLIPPDQVTEIGWLRFQQEARAIAKLEHINLVKVSDLGIHEGCLPFYAMEFIQGQTLADMLAVKSPLPLLTTLEIFAQICNGIDDAHRAGVIHRDLKPANIMVSQQGNKIAVKILDFGLAKLSQQDRDKQSLTSVGEIFGSPFYMSPEQCSGDKVDNRSDIYSIGCSLYECLTGCPPFTGHLASAIVFSHQEADPPSLASVVGAKVYPDSLEVVLAKLLRKNPVERYQNLTELRGDLERVSRGEAVLPYYRSRSAAPVVEDSDRSSDSKRKGAGRLEEAKEFGRLKIMLVIGLILIITAGGGLLFYKDKSAPLAKAPLIKKPAAGTSEGGDDFFQEMGRQFAADEPSKVRPKSADLTTPYSVIESKNGQNVRVFYFPTDVEIGGIKAEADVDMIIARGKLTFPADCTFLFSPAPRLAHYKSYFARFRPGEITGLVLARPVDINELFQALRQLPDLASIKVIRFRQPTQINSDSVKTLNLCINVDSFASNEDGLNENSLCQLCFLKNLSHLVAQRYAHTDRVLALLANSTEMDDLDLAFSTVSDDSLRCIAKMPNLRALHVDGAIMTPARLQILSEAPKLQELWLGDTIKFDGPALAIIQRFKHLNRLGLNAESPGNDALTKRKMKLVLKGIQVSFTNGNEDIDAASVENDFTSKATESHTQAK